MNQSRRDAHYSIRSQYVRSLASKWVRKYRPDIWQLCRDDAYQKYPLVRKQVDLPVALDHDERGPQAGKGSRK